MPRSIAATLIAAPPLAGLFWRSGEVSFLAALAAMAVLVFVAMHAGLLLLRAADAADLPLAAAWVLGIFASALAVLALVTAFGLLAAHAFLVWAVLVLGAAFAFRGAGRLASGDVVSLLLCAAATVFWCHGIAEVPLILARDGLMTTWVDQFGHGGVISQFGDPRAAGRQAILLADLPRPFYHYASYVLPAVFAWPLDLPGLPLATSVWVPLGFFTLCAGVYALGATLGGRAGGVAALAVLALLPDAGAYGFHNLAFAYYWYMLAVPGGSYGVAACLLSFAFLCRWSQQRMPRPLLAGFSVVAMSWAVRAHLFALAFPAFVASAAWMTPFVQRRKLACLLIASVLAALAVLGYYALFPDAVPALAQFLEQSHNHLHPPVYQSWYLGLKKAVAPAVSMPLGVLLVYAACLGVFLVLYPLSVLLLHRSQGLRAIDAVPVVVLAIYLLLMIGAPVPASGVATEWTQRPFVLVYAVVAVWTAAGFARWAALHGGVRASRVRLALIAVAAAWVVGLLYFTVPDPRWKRVHAMPEGLTESARFVRANGRPGDVFAVQGLSAGPVYMDLAVQFASLTGMPAYLGVPFIQASRGGSLAQAVRERHQALAQVAEASQLPAALARLQQLGVHWYVVPAGETLRWDPERRHAAFARPGLAVYSVRGK